MSKPTQYRGCSGAGRGVYVEKNEGVIRIWWERWAATIKGGKGIRYNHLHDLNYFATRGGPIEPRCRCGEKVPTELITMANLQQLGV